MTLQEHIDQHHAEEYLTCPEDCWCWDAERLLERAQLEQDQIKDKLAKFGLLCLADHRICSADLDGGWLENKAIECGLLHHVHVTEPCEGDCDCAYWDTFPQDCLRLVPELEALVNESDEENAV